MKSNTDVLEEVMSKTARLPDQSDATQRLLTFQQQLDEVLA